MGGVRLALLALLVGCGHAPAQEAAPRAGRSPGPGEIGTGDAFEVVDTAATGDWVVLCQRRGDVTAPYLVIGAGAGERLDEFVAADDDGDLIVVIVGGRLLLYDRLRGRVVDLTTTLGADPRDDAADEFVHSHRAATVDGGRVAFWRGDGDEREAVVFEPVSERETGIPMPLPGGYRLALEGPWLLAVPREPGAALETNGGAARACRGRGVGCVLPSRRSPLPPTYVAHLEAGVAGPRPDFVTTWGDAIVVRDAGGALWLESSAGARTELAPASCGAELGALDGDRYLIACAREVDDQGRAPLAIVAREGDTKFKKIEVRVRPQSLVLLSLVGEQVWGLAQLARTSGGIVGTPDPWDASLWTRIGSRALLREGGKFATVDLRERVRIDLDGWDLPEVRAPVLPRQDELVAVDPYLVDLGQLGNRGRFEGMAHAVSRDGRVLVSDRPAKPGPDGRPAAKGPLRWVTPRPAR